MTQSGNRVRLNRRLLLATLVGALVPAQISHAQNNTLTTRIRATLAATDYLQAKLAIDAIINPQIDNTAMSLAVDRLAVATRELAGNSADDARKLAAVRTVIYQAGTWNDNRVATFKTSSWPRM